MRYVLEKKISSIFIILMFYTLLSPVFWPVPLLLFLLFLFVSLFLFLNLELSFRDASWPWMRLEKGPKTKRLCQVHRPRGEFASAIEPRHKTNVFVASWFANPPFKKKKGFANRVSRRSSDRRRDSRGFNEKNRYCSLVSYLKIPMRMVWSLVMPMLPLGALRLFFTSYPIIRLKILTIINL